VRGEHTRRETTQFARERCFSVGDARCADDGLLGVHHRVPSGFRQRLRPGPSNDVALQRRRPAGWSYHGSFIRSAAHPYDPRPGERDLHTKKLLRRTSSGR
jgi:hypothetical protein